MSDPQTVIVTGTSRGLGAAAARILAQMGAQVVLTARSAVPLDALTEEIRAAGGSAFAIAGDITAPNTAQRVVAAAVERFGRVDALINNAGMLTPLARLEDADPEAWLRTLDVNVIGPLLLTRAALPHLRHTKGRVINVSSGAAIKAVTGWGAYCVSKAALNHFNLMLAHEEPDITAIAVRPGKIDTAMQGTLRAEGAGHMDDATHARFVGHFEKGELNPPELPGRATALLALRAPHAWSGAFVAWDDERVAALANG